MVLLLTKVLLCKKRIRETRDNTTIKTLYGIEEVTGKSMRSDPTIDAIPNSKEPKAAEAVPAVSGKGSSAKEAVPPTKNMAPVQAMTMGSKNPLKDRPVAQCQQNMLTPPTNMRAIPVKMVL